MSKKTILGSISIIAVVLIGYMITPPSHKPGTYTAKISVDFEDFTVSLKFSFEVVDSFSVAQETVVFRNETTFTLDDEKINVTIIAVGYDKFPLKPDSKADFNIYIYVNGEHIYVRPTDVQGIVSLPDGNYENALILVHKGNLIFRFAIRYKAEIAIITFLLIAFLWLTEIIPLVASAILVPVISVVFGLSTAKAALAPMFDPVIALFLGGFLLARAMSKYQLDKRLALSLIARTNSPKQLAFLMMLTTTFLSFWMSNTAVAALMIPIALALLKTIEKERGSSYGKAMILGIAYAATIGGMGTIIGSPPNAIAVSLLKDIADIDLSFLEWMIFALPFTFLMLIIAFFYLNAVYSTRKDIQEGKIALEAINKEYIKLQLIEMGPLKKEEKLTIVILISTVFLWMTQKLPVSIMGWSGHGISSGIIALGSIVALFTLGILDKSDLNKISWDTLLIFGGGIVLGNLLVASGMSEWIVAHVIGLRNPFIILVLIGFLSLVITAFASNTAAAVILLPLAIPIGSALGINPVIPALLVAIGTSTDFALPIGTPPTMLAYSTGYHKFREIVKVGFPLMILGILLLTLVVAPVWLILMG